MWNPASTWSTEFGYDVRTFNVPGFVCPSDQFPYMPAGFKNWVSGNDESQSWVSGDSGNTATTYLFCTGDGSDTQEWWGARPATSSGVVTRNKGRSMFLPGIRQSWEDCTDGTSNTIAIGEASKATGRSIPGDVPPGTDNVKGGIVATGLGSSLATDVTARLECIAAVEGKIIKAGKVSRSIRGNLMNGFVSASLFHTILPPNSPNCSAATYPGDIGWGIFAAQSYHSGGVNVVFFDGSVHFMSDTINAVSSGIVSPGPKVQVNSSNPSEFGVWGALGGVDCKNWRGE
jgi:prepilin-type processing-associated H-X9-DG protein